MNKTAVKNFAVWARRKLISEITYKAGLIGINDKGISQPLSISTGNIQFFEIGTGKPNEISDHEIKQRNALVKRISEKESTSDYKTAFQFVIEEVAYTWFNRLIAIRFMEVNDYLPSRIRVLSSEIPAKSEPDMVTKPFDTDMEFSTYETNQIMQLKQENKLDELFRMLFIKQCNKLNEVLPELFEKTADYTELLLTLSFTDSDSIVSHLVNDIIEDDFTEAVEIIGWMYQFYNTEPKDEVFALLKKNVKITKERIPAATQLFTPDWIVHYMVENSLGRLWDEGHPNDDLKADWEYFLEEAEQEESVKEELQKIRTECKKLNTRDIKVIDPCMGSGHILVYAFEVLMKIYESQGYTQRDAASAIIENNLYGLDIDDRAYQLAYFAVMMKARKYDRRFLTRGVLPKIFSIKESNGINRTHLQYLGHSLNDMERNMAIQQLEYMLDTFYDAKEYGSILNIDDCNWELLRSFVEDFHIEGQMSLESIGVEDSQEKLKEIVAIGEAMAQKYDVVVTNPPYMGSSGMSTKLSNYLKANYSTTKTDLFAAFIEKGNTMTKYRGYNCMVTMQSWMFLSSFEKMRKAILNKKTITNLMHMGNMVMGIAFGTAVSNIRNCIIKQYKGTYNHIAMQDIGNADSPTKFPVKDNRFAQISSDRFSKIPGSPIAYWVSQKMLNAFESNDTIANLAPPKQGLATADNNRFLRLWFEPIQAKIGFEIGDCSEALHSGLKWFPYNKGGAFRRWYGNRDYVVNWENDGFEIKNFKDENGKIRSRPQNLGYYFQPAITWSDITSAAFSGRYCEKGFIFDIKGSSGFPEDDKIFYILGFLNSSVSQKCIKILNPTVTTQVGDMARIPVAFIEKMKNQVESIVQQNIAISKADWDSFETSWDFICHPLIRKYSTIIRVYSKWETTCTERFNMLKSNEEELNRIFIDIYGLQDELTSEVEEKDVTVRRADLQRDIKNFISYAVGCMFGRYSLDVDGLAYAGGDWDDSKYTKFIPDKDNCILIADEEYFEDDIVGRFVEFVKCVYGAENLEENLDFIAKALVNKENTSREIIRNYFLNDFFKDHCSTYSVTGSGKRPIYWLYESGKQNGFKALVYMHRYTADTTGIVRVDYLHKIQKIYMNEIDRMIDTAESSNNAREIAQAEKRKEKLVKQLKETKEYDEKIAHLAISRIAIDLDDGVKVNYEKVQTGQDGNKFDILSKI